MQITNLLIVYFMFRKGSIFFYQSHSSDFFHRVLLLAAVEGGSQNLGHCLHLKKLLSAKITYKHLNDVVGKNYVVYVVLEK